MAETTPELKITTVESSELKGGIPLNDWDAVENALQIYMGGRTKDSLVQHQEAVDLINHPLILADYFDHASRIDKEALLSRILTDAKKDLKRRPFSHMGFDYDAVGTPFFKTFLNIIEDPDQRGIYILESGTARLERVGEAGLAQELGISQGLVYKKLEATFQPDGDNFVLDIAQLADKLKSAGLTAPNLFSMESYLRGALVGFGYRQSVVNLPHEDGINVAMNLWVGNRFNERQDQWVSKGMILSGPLRRLRKGGSFVTKDPYLDFTITRIAPEGYELWDKITIPAIDPSMVASMNQLASNMFTAFTD